MGLESGGEVGGGGGARWGGGHGQEVEVIWMPWEWRLRVKRVEQGRIG
jgi:hypothetical protein